MPLKGIKVIELGGLAPGPLCGKFLRDFGASVTVVNKVLAESSFHFRYYLLLSMSLLFDNDIF